MFKSKSFTPAYFLRNRHSQTVFPSWFRRQVEPTIEIEKFELDDGDFVECCWNSKPKIDENKPIVVLFHGLTGSFYSSYIQGMMNALEVAGFASVIMQFRGCSGKPNRLPRSYHSGDTGDARAWIDYIAKNYPNNNLYAVGYSLGGNVLLKLLGEDAASSLLSAAVSVSAPLQLDVCADAINQGLSKLYQYRLMENLKETLLAKYKIFDMQKILGIDEQGVEKLKTFWEFDEAYTAPIHGFSSAKDYYEKSSSRQFLKEIAVDTLILHSRDDPFANKKMLPSKKELSPNVKMELSSHGGHVGFVGGDLFGQKYWLEERIVNYLNEQEKR